ncbi:WXG100 family type VII secretion target [Cryptosporangium minutisporangium]|uniref:WXG100 family type VII secretion target n=1 Tax=Cryptosporangium minutisporangium TaxID=113569 RepID=A0ABP6TC43_9ACTN
MAMNVTPQMLIDAAQKAENVGEGIAGQLTNLLYTIQSEGGASFQGGGGSALQGVSAQLGEQLKQILTALNTMSGNVNAASADYGTSDQEIAREIQTVGNAYNPGSGSVVTALTNG